MKRFFLDALLWRSPASLVLALIVLALLGVVVFLLPGTKEVLPANLFPTPSP